MHKYLNFPCVSLPYSDSVHKVLQIICRTLHNFTLFKGNSCTKYFRFVEPSIISLPKATWCTKNLRFIEPCIISLSKDNSMHIVSQICRTFHDFTIPNNSVHKYLGFIDLPFKCHTIHNEVLVRTHWKHALPNLCTDNTHYQLSKSTSGVCVCNRPSKGPTFTCIESTVC